MRPIKFRAWDKKYTIMLEPEAFNRNDIWIGGDGSVYEIEEWSGYSGGGKIENNVSDQYILMQYTGVKDRNGKEIYEGDLIKDPHGIGEVEWVQEHCAFLVFTSEPSLYHGIESDGTLQNTEVIGNIYENKELIS